MPEDRLCTEPFGPRAPCSFPFRGEGCDVTWSAHAEPAWSALVAVWAVLVAVPTVIEALRLRGDRSAAGRRRAWTSADRVHAAAVGIGLAQLIMLCDAESMGARLPRVAARIFLRKITATPRPRRGESAETSRGGRDVESLRRRVVAAATRRVRGDESWRPRRGESAETSRTFRRDRHALQVRGDAGARGSRAVPARLRRRDGRRDVG